MVCGAAGHCISEAEGCICGPGQVCGRWQVKEAGLKGLHARAVSAFKCFKSITLNHVLRYCQVLFRNILPTKARLIMPKLLQNLSRTWIHGLNGERLGQIAMNDDCLLSGDAFPWCICMESRMSRTAGMRAIDWKRVIKAVPLERMASSRTLICLIMIHKFN